jgi:GTP-binding protein
MRDERREAAVQFVDEVTIEVHAGDGGNGAIAMRREKWRPLGGPSGGDGGNGGDVILRADPQLTTLLDLTYTRVVKAEPGEHGRGSDQYGKAGKDRDLRIPVGTQVYDAESGELLIDFDAPGQTFPIKGGRGGRGNMHFATASERAPRRAEDGRPGEHRKLRLELKLLADVGIVGFPNAGKSTLIAAISKARPKVADYPFTTLVPNLGVVSRGIDRSFVVADIPGIIEGAADGAGLGVRFLKHIERTRVLVHLVTVDPDPERKPLKDYDVLRKELERFDPELAKRPSVVAFSKLDLPDAREALPALRKTLKRRGVPLLALSAPTREGIEELLDAVERLLAENPVPPTPRRVALPRKGRENVEQGESDEDEAIEEAP